MNKLTRDGKLVITVKAGMWSPLGDHPGLGVPVLPPPLCAWGGAWGLGRGLRFRVGASLGPDDVTAHAGRCRGGDVRARAEVCVCLPPGLGRLCSLAPHLQCSLLQPSSRREGRAVRCGHPAGPPGTAGDCAGGLAAPSGLAGRPCFPAVTVALLLPCWRGWHGTLPGAAAADVDGAAMTPLPSPAVPAGPDPPAPFPPPASGSAEASRRWRQVR